MDRREFVEYCVLQNRMKPAEALSLWTETQEELMKGVRFDAGSPGEFLGNLTACLDAMSERSRRTLFALLKEDYSEFTGEKRRAR